MAKGDLLICQTCGTTTTQLFVECKMYEELSEELNISRDIGISPGSNLDNKINTIEDRTFQKNTNTAFIIR